MLLSVAVFAAAATLFLLIVFLMVPALQTRRLLTQGLIVDGVTSKRSLAAQQELIRNQAQRPVEAYFRAAEKGRGEPDHLDAKLFRAGFYHPSAPAIYTLLRMGTVAVAFVGAYWSLTYLLPPHLPGAFAFLGSGFFALCCIVIPSVGLDRFEKGQKQKYRRGFPDFMDMMITCADAGMSLEAAVERVSHELAGTHKALGIQLAIMTLQMRAGKPLRDALRDLSDRIAIEEARSLAVLFRQSEELGTSLTDALRVYADEMRTQRILAAEEKANSLPVKLVIPLGLCIFPVVLMISMLPVILRMKGIMY